MCRLLACLCLSVLIPFEGKGASICAPNCIHFFPALWDSKCIRMTPPCLQKCDGWLGNSTNSPAHALSGSITLAIYLPLASPGLAAIFHIVSFSHYDRTTIGPFMDLGGTGKEPWSFQNLCLQNFKTFNLRDLGISPPPMTPTYSERLGGCLFSLGP